MEVASPSLKKLWNEWQLRTLILLSLTAQIVLIISGHRRKYIRKIWINMLVWPAYVAADFVATAALGVITSNLFKNSGPLNANMELTAFWAQFLLLHLGGPDTITAYAAEDNELWPRHLLQLVVRSGVAFYIFLMAWTGSVLSVLAIPMMLVGLIKYGERTWVLWSASQERRRQSISEHDADKFQTADDRDDQTADDREEGSSTGSHGQMPLSCSPPAERILDISDHSVSDDEGNNLLVTAYGLLDRITKRLFVDDAPTTADRKTSASVLKRMSPNNGFRVIEMELGFMFDMLYTKAMVTHTRRGIALRFTTFLVTCVVLVSFYSFAYHIQSYSKVNLNLTLLLLTVGIFLELYASLVLLFSDQTVVSMRKHNRTNILKAITSLRLFRKPTWSNTMAQYCLVRPISFSYGKRLLRNLPKACLEFSYLSKIEEKLEKDQYEGYRQVPVPLKELMFNYYDEYNQSNPESEDRTTFAMRASRGQSSIRRNYSHARWYSSARFKLMELEQIITFWHIVTELGYYLDHDRMKGSTNHVYKMSKYISRYMMHLLRTSPNLLAPGEVRRGETSFQSTCDELRAMLKSSNSEAGINEQATQKERKRKTKIEASKCLFDQFRNSDEVEELHYFFLDKGRLAPLACVTLNMLFKQEEEVEVEKRWKTIWGIWMELITSASIETKGIQHARKLGEGGELLTAAWLLMAHCIY